MVDTDEFQILVIHKVNFVLVNTVLKSALCQLGMVELMVEHADSDFLTQKVTSKNFFIKEKSSHGNEYT